MHWYYAKYMIGERAEFIWIRAYTAADALVCLHGNTQGKLEPGLCENRRFAELKCMEGRPKSWNGEHRPFYMEDWRDDQG